MTSRCLGEAIRSFSFDIMINSLPKIIFIVRNVEVWDNFQLYKNIFYLLRSWLEFDLFKFIFSQRELNFERFSRNLYETILDELPIQCANDAFKFIFLCNKGNICPARIFDDMIDTNLDLANFILDIQLEELITAAPLTLGYLS